jgi:hypothetical protein
VLSSQIIPLETTICSHVPLVGRQIRLLNASYSYKHLSYCWIFNGVTEIDFPLIWRSKEETNTNRCTNHNMEI